MTDIRLFERDRWSLRNQCATLASSDTVFDLELERPKKPMTSENPTTADEREDGRRWVDPRVDASVVKRLRKVSDVSVSGMGGHQPRSAKGGSFHDEFDGGHDGDD